MTCKPVIENIIPKIVWRIICPLGKEYSLRIHVPITNSKTMRPTKQQKDPIISPFSNEIKFDINLNNPWLSEIPIFELYILPITP